MKYFSNMAWGSLLLTASACSSGGAGSGTGVAGDELPPISGEAPPISGEAPPTSGDPQGGGFRCAESYSCTVTAGGKSETSTGKVKCDEIPADGVLRDKSGKAIGKVTVGADGTIRIASSEQGQSFTVVCVPN
jgi:hypothetical protein